MHEVLKNFCFAVFFICGIVAAFAWYATSGDNVFWIRLASTVASTFALVVFLRLHFKADQAPDYLVQRHRKPFDCQDVRIAIEPTVSEGMLVLNIYFQSNFTGDSVIYLGLRPSQGLLGRAKGLDLQLGPIDCPPAGFGVMRWPIPVPIESQGKKVKFDIGLSATYPNGKGRRVRFRSGLRVLHKADFQRDPSMNIMSIRLISYRPAQCTLQMPENVAEVLQDDAVEQEEIFWRLGEEPLAQDWHQGASFAKANG